MSGECPFSPLLPFRASRRCITSWRDSRTSGMAAGCLCNAPNKADITSLLSGCGVQRIFLVTLQAVPGRRVHAGKRGLAGQQPAQLPHGRRILSSTASARGAQAATARRAHQP